MAVQSTQAIIARCTASPAAIASGVRQEVKVDVKDVWPRFSAFATIRKPLGRIPCPRAISFAATNIEPISSLSASVFHGGLHVFFGDQNMRGGRGLTSSNANTAYFIHFCRGISPATILQNAD